MSENLSIDEIIRRAQQINEEAERQLRAAESSLNQKAKAVIEEVVVDEEAVAKRIADAYRRAEEDEDVKQFVPSKKENTAEEFSEDEEDVKIASSDDMKKTVTMPSVKEDGSSKQTTKAIPILDGEPEFDSEPAENSKTRTFGTPQEEEKTKMITLAAPASESSGDGLEKIPTLVSQEHALDNFGKDGSEDDSSIQIKLDGFDDRIDTVEKIDERVAEKELERRREEKIGKFRLFGPDETDSELGGSAAREDDYDTDSDRESFLDNLYSKKTVLGVRLIVTGVLFALIMVMSVFRDSAYFPLFLSEHKIYFGTMLALYGIALLVNINVFLHGFNFGKSVNFDFPVSLVSLGIGAHTLMLFLNDGLWMDNGVALAGAGAFSLFMSQLGKLKMMTRIIDNFDFISGGAKKYTVENITNAVDAAIISRGLVEDEEPQLKMSVKTDFPTNFLEISCKREPADKSARRVFLLDLIFSAVLFGVLMAVEKNLNTAINIAFCALAVSVPSSALYITNSLLADISAQLSPYGSRVCGYEGAAMAQDASAMVLEAADLFDKDSCDLHGIKTFGGAKIDDAIIHTAAVIIQTKSPLAHVFDDVIIGQQSILPKVEGVQYEERLGTSAWIYKRKVLVGTRELMQHHSIRLPNQSFEKKYTIKDRKALYLAVDGQLIAMFIVSYSANPDLKRELRKLEKSGITLIVKSSDPYINEESLAELFRVPEGFIRVMNYSAARVYDKYSNLDVEKSPAYVVHDGSALGFVSAMRGAEILYGIGGLLTFLETFGSLLGIAALGLLSVVQAFGQITALAIVAFHIIWTAFMTIVMKLRGIGL